MPGQGPYAPPAFAPASYAGMGGPAPMGPMPGGPGMAGMPGMPIGSGGGDCYPGGGICDGWTNHYFGFGEFLYLRPRNAEVAYAVPIDSTAAAGGTLVQVGPVSVADPNYAPAFRVGFGAVISPRSALAVTYTQFDHKINDLLSVPGTGILRSLVSHPNPLTAGGNGTDAGADLQTQFQLLDIDYKGLLIYDPEYQLNYVVGARYANLEQHFMAGFTAGTGTFEDVHAESEFDGGGLKLGLEGLRFHPTTQFFVYGKGYTSFLAGIFRARYQDTFAPPGNANPAITSFNASRLVTMLDLETGVGWQNFGGNLRFSAGYMFSAWYNVLRVNEFINSVQTNNFVNTTSNLNSLMTFDGLTAKVEVLW